MGDITLGQIYSVMGIIVAVFAVFTAFAQVVKKAIDRIYKPVNDLSKQMTDGIKKIEEDISIVKTGLQSSLRRQIVVLCEESLKNGYITEDNLEWLTKAYADYENLGKNGFIQELYKKTVKLPMR